MTVTVSLVSYRVPRCQPVVEGSRAPIEFTLVGSEFLVLGELRNEERRVLVTGCHNLLENRAISGTNGILEEGSLDVECCQNVLALRLLGSFFRLAPSLLVLVIPMDVFQEVIQRDSLSHLVEDVRVFWGRRTDLEPAALPASPNAGAFAVFTKTDRVADTCVYGDVC